MVKARSNLAAQTVRDVFAVGALVCWPYNPLFNCLMTHRSSGMQAGRVDLLVCCRSGLENACKTVRRNISCHSLLMPQVVCITRTYIKQCMFVCTKFIQTVHVCFKFAQLPRYLFSQKKSTVVGKHCINLVQTTLNFKQTLNELENTGLDVPNP